MNLLSSRSQSCLDRLVLRGTWKKYLHLPGDRFGESESTWTGSSPHISGLNNNGLYYANGSLTA